MQTQRSGTRSTNRNRTRFGEIILCEWHNTPLIDENGQVVGIASMARDITQEEIAQERLRRSEAHKSAILNSAIDCIISIDHEGRVVDWNAAAERTFGFSSVEAVGQPVTALILPPLRDSYQAGLIHSLKNGNCPAFHTQIELPAQRRNGTQFQAEITATALEVETQALYTIYLRDITERNIMEAEREALLVQTESLLADALERADHDPLTGLLNHRAFHKRLKEDMGVKDSLDGGRLENRRGAVLLVDLDNFKFFNDAYGHLAGDDVLRHLALAFTSVCCDSDTLARFGGDEFALLLPGATEADAQAMAGTLCAAAMMVGYHPPGYETPIPFSLSLGIACFPEDAVTRTALLELADARLRISKSGGEADSHASSIRRSLARSVGGFTMLDALVTAVDNKDRYTRRHSEDVMHYSLEIASALGLDAEAQRVIEIAALLHDVGKIGVPDAILRKPGRLSADDFEAIKQHPMMGSVIVGAVPGFEETLDAVRHHHERWDGSGYPFGLRGDQTPLSARLMAVADAFSAMTTDRPYRKGMDPQKALEILENGAGTQWDPACVRALLQVRRPSSAAASECVSARSLPGTPKP
jgi:diguanylate cyclase (GGDEF)-like protein/PAS domain S-box-containing protein